MLRLTIAIAGILTLSAGEMKAQDLGPMKEINGLLGPANPKGFAVDTLATINLGEEFPNVAEARALKFRARFVTLQPRGIVLIHSHVRRPATTYIVSGEVVEHRSDVEGPLVRKAGEATMDVRGIAQWWENKSDEVVTMFVGDVVSPNSSTEQ
jgi:quercetin dioxygenase-like cupin family protein